MPALPSWEVPRLSALVRGLELQQRQEVRPCQTRRCSLAILDYPSSQELLLLASLLALPQLEEEEEFPLPLLLFRRLRAMQVHRSCSSSPPAVVVAAVRWLLLASVSPLHLSSTLAGCCPLLLLLGEGCRTLGGSQQGSEIVAPPQAVKMASEEEEEEEQEQEQEEEHASALVEKSAIPIEEGQHTLCLHFEADAFQELANEAALEPLGC